MPAPLYARWTPKKASAQNQSSPTAEAPRVEQQQAVSLPETHGKENKKRKEKRQTIEEGFKIIESPVVEDSVPNAQEDETFSEVSVSAKKPKKRKRELQGDDEVDGETPKKHKAVLSKFQKVVKRRKVQDNSAQHASAAEEPEPQQELHDLEPLPQPAPIPEPAFEPTYSTLPTWLAHPTTVEASKKFPFSELGVHSEFLKELENQGFTDALAVQSALLPMLHSGYEQHIGDICVSARTGSGKTLAYLLPIIEALRDRVVTELSAIVVVPKRQLVDQAVQLAETLCTGTKLKIGTAVGTVPFATEQKQLVKMRAQYDPKGASKLHERAAQQLETGFVERGGILDELMGMPIDHVPRYYSVVDILICTPGRLVEHIESTTGFLLRGVKWLVIDEADQLMDQDFQGWSTILMDAIHGETPGDFANIKEQLQKHRQGSVWSMALPTRRQVTKVVLSATMKTDLTKLGTLRLKRPKFVVVEDEVAPQEQRQPRDADVFELPSTLDEFAVPVGDGRNKPLYLLYLLLNYVFYGETDAEKDLSISEPSADDSDEKGSFSIAKHQNRVLIFTKSNESAARLSHLLSALEPTLKNYLRTMTPSATAKESKKLLKQFSAGTIKILIASDAASRGLDIPGISHVVNYDMPPSITSYVHRVGRTARASKAGQAWTFFSKTEAAWFWKQIARGESVRRGDKVQRTEWKERDVTWDRKLAYSAALVELEGAVKGSTDTAY